MPAEGGTAQETGGETPTTVRSGSCPWTMSSDWTVGWRSVAVADTVGCMVVKDHPGCCCYCCRGIVVCADRSVRVGTPSIVLWCWARGIHPSSLIADGAPDADWVDLVEV